MLQFVLMRNDLNDPKPVEANADRTTTPRNVRVSDQLFADYKRAVKIADPEDEWQQAIRRHMRAFVAEHLG